MRRRENHLTENWHGFINNTEQNRPKKIFLLAVSNFSPSFFCTHFNQAFVTAGHRISFDKFINDSQLYSVLYCQVQSEQRGWRKAGSGQSQTEEQSSQVWARPVGGS